MAFFFFVYFLFNFCALNCRDALTVAMLRPDSIDKLLAAENKLVSQLGLLDFGVTVCCPRGNRVQTPMHRRVLPVTPNAWVILVVVQVEDLVAPVLSRRHVLEWPWSHNLVCVLHGRNSLQLLLLLFLWVFLQMELPQLQLGSVNGTP